MLALAWQRFIRAGSILSTRCVPQLISQRREHLKLLGLKRVSKEVTLKDYLSDKYGDDEKKGKKREPSVHVGKPASDNATSPLVKETDLDA